MFKIHVNLSKSSPTQLSLLLHEPQQGLTRELEIQHWRRLPAGPEPPALGSSDTWALPMPVPTPTPLPKPTKPP